MCRQPSGTDVCITFKSSHMRGRFRWSADGPWPLTAPSFGWWVVLGLPLSEHWGRACPKSVWDGLWASLGPFESESALWYFLWFSVGPKCATCILAQKHILHVLKVKCGLGIYLDKDVYKKCKLSWKKVRIRNTNSHDFLIKLTLRNDC